MEAHTRDPRSIPRGSLEHPYGLGSVESTNGVLVESACSGLTKLKLPTLCRLAIFGSGVANEDVDAPDQHDVRACDRCRRGPKAVVQDEVISADKERSSSHGLVSSR
jgi:hypothetical protein